MTTNLQVDRPSSSSVPVLDRRMALALLGLLVLVGALAGVIRLLMGLGATTNLSDTYSWGIWIGFDFTLIAFAGAGFTIAALAHVLRQHQYHDAVRPAILAGFIGYVAVLLLLVLDLGRPDRFYNFLLFWNPHSPLFEISWCIILYTTVLFIETSPFLLERLRLKRLLGLTGKIMLVVAIAGVTLSSLHQSTLGTLYLNMPYRLHALWFAPLLPLLFFVSAVMAGLSMAALTYLLATRIARRETKPEIVRGLATLAGWAGVVYLALKLGDLLISGELHLIFDRRRLQRLVVDRGRHRPYPADHPAVCALFPQASLGSGRRPAPDAFRRADEPLQRHDVRPDPAARCNLLTPPDGVALHAWRVGRRRPRLGDRHPPPCDLRQQGRQARLNPLDNHRLAKT